MVESKVSGVIVRPAPSFVDARGSITNIAIGDFATVSLIRSLAKTFRSRHYHKADSHVLYVLEGQMLYWERDLDGSYGEPKTVNQGEAVYTGPLVIHQTYFPVNTTLLSMSKKPRDHQSHEADVERIEEPWQTPPSE